jgi:hypothetical protein
MTSLHARAEAHHIQTYRDNVLMVAQQMRGRIRPAITDVPASGEAVAASDLVGRVRASRVSPTERRNVENVPENSRRWLVFPNPVKSGQYISTAEKLQRAMDPTSTYVQAHTAAVVREIDDIALGIIEGDEGSFSISTGGILGAAVVGKNPGAGTSSLPSACYTLVGGTGLTLPKLMEAKERLNKDEFGVDDDDVLYCAITPKQVTDLLTIADGDGASLNAFQQLQLQSGKPTTLLGMTWIVTNRLPLVDGDRYCPIWSKKNIVMGVWQDIQGEMWNDTHADYQPYARVQAFVDAVRVQDRGVHVIICNE